MASSDLGSVPDNAPLPATPSGFFYGWVIVGAVFFTLTVTAGLGFYNASVILRAAITELEISVTSVSGATALFFAISGSTSFALSRRMETADIRLFYLAGGIIGAGALAGLSFVTNVVGLYLFFAVFGVGFSLAGLVPGMTLVTRWFLTNRSNAVSVASTGLSLGGIAITPIASVTIADRTLAGAGPLMAAAWILGIVPIGLILIRSYPTDKGLRPYGSRIDLAQPEPAEFRSTESEPAEKTRDATAGASFSEARTSRFFVATAGAYLLVFFAQVGALAHLFNLTAERVDDNAGRATLSLLAFSSIMGRLTGGVVVTKMPPLRFAAGMMLVQAVGLLMLSQASTALSISVGAVVFGISVGNLLMLQPLIIAEAFGVAEYGRIYSFAQLITTVGVAGGPLMIGIMRDGASYELAFIVASIICVLAFVLFGFSGGMAAAHRLWPPTPTTTPNT